ncbi:MAG TPA: trehalose-6-phosphate synthase [Ktedonobacterales bacterium]|nr:trehalose-6-phosphate synthase [Ktedonobacterales bacterium]
MGTFKGLGTHTHTDTQTQSLVYTSHIRQRGADGRRLIFVTNRGPVEHHFGADGTPEARRGAGGVVSGLLCAAQGRHVSWISLAMTDADRAVEMEQESDDGVLVGPAGFDHLTSRLVSVPDDIYRRHYDGFSNRVLWFAQHGLEWAEAPRADAVRDCWERGYAPVNGAVAEAVVAELAACGVETPVMFHDYHLYLAPGLIRKRLPEARLLHFIHIPWPETRAWARLPDEIVRAIYRGLAANDVIGFQTPRDARNFLSGVERYLPEADVTRDLGSLYWRGRRVHVRHYPIALNPAAVQASAAAPEAVAAASELRERLWLEDGRKLIMRVDRVEPTKNIVRGFEAYERLLEAHADLRGAAVFLALLVPSREGLPEYQAYARQVREAIARINQRFGRPGWEPIIAVFGNNHARALACMRDYDVLLVNPLIDGMNLVAKEGGLLNERDGVIVLSHCAGAYEQLRDGVLGVDPRDVDATAQALYTALAMPAKRRTELAETVRTVLLQESAGSWLSAQLKDLRLARGTATRLPSVELLPGAGGSAGHMSEVVHEVEIPAVVGLPGRFTASSPAAARLAWPPREPLILPVLTGEDIPPTPIDDEPLELPI